MVRAISSFSGTFFSYAARTEAQDPSLEGPFGFHLEEGVAL